MIIDDKYTGVTVFKLNSISFSPSNLIISFFYFSLAEPKLAVWYLVLLLPVHLECNQLPILASLFWTLLGAESLLTISFAADLHAVSL